MNQWHERRKQEKVQAAATARAQMRHSGERQENERAYLSLGVIVCVPPLAEALKLMALFIRGRDIGSPDPGFLTFKQCSSSHGSFFFP
jgi:hypothetical protein